MGTLVNTSFFEICARTGGGSSHCNDTASSMDYDHAEADVVFMEPMHYHTNVGTLSNACDRLACDESYMFLAFRTGTLSCWSISAL